MKETQAHLKSRIEDFLDVATPSEQMELDKARAQLLALMQ